MAANALAAPRRVSPFDARAQTISDIAPLSAPRRGPTIERRRLLRLLAARADVPIVVLAASAGFGKSTLAEQWSRKCQRPTALLRLSSRDNEASVLVDDLVRCLEDLLPGAAALRAELAHPAATVDHVLPTLADALARSAPFELILDDVHRVSTPSSLSVLRFLLETTPAGSQLMLLSTGDVVLPLASRRVAADLLELRADQLAFDFDETRALAIRRGIALSEASLHDIHQRTQGWPGGLELALQAALAPGSGGDGDLVHATQREIADYLLETVLERESDRQQEFLLATSVARRMTAPLCDAILGMVGSDRALRDLERSNSFVIPLDHRRGWYRYHPLFGEVLRSELDRRHPGLAAVYLARAAGWHERDRSDPEEGFRCARECGDLARAGRIALACTAGLMARGRREGMRSWIDRCTDDEIGGDPQLAIAAAWLYSSRGEGLQALRCAVAAERGDLSGPSADGASSVASSLAHLRATLGYRGVHEMLADAERVYANERETSARWVVESCRFIGIAHLLLDRPAESIVALREALMLATAPELTAARIVCLGYLALAASESARWPEARKWAREAKALVAEHDLGDALAAAVAFTAKATVLVHDGDLYRAAQDLAKARELGHRFGGIRWLIADMELRWGQISLHLGDRLLACDHAGRARAALNGYIDPGNLGSRLGALGERIHRAGDLKLTPAELRILPFLPTHLLVKEIAARLHLSPATVKTQLHAIFNKLEVSTRSDAVEKMEQLGLEAARALPAASR